jgi:Fe-S cluster biosynthesis and repair protein YggX
MARNVYCVLLKREAEGMDYLPYPGELGKRIYDSISKEAWAQWVAHQTMLINENRLTPIEPKARAFLVAEMEKFLVRHRVGEAEGVRAEVGRKRRRLR